MKRLFSTLPLLNIHLITANLQNIFNQTETLSKELDLANSSKVNLNQLLKELSQGYGCWCNFKKDGHLKGSGKPVDEIDQICRTLHDGYKCSHVDSFKETSLVDSETGEVTAGEKCLPTTVRYNPGILPGSSYMLDYEDPSELLTIECAFENPDNHCAYRSCIIEGYMVLSMVNILLENIPILEEFKYSNGFDRSTECHSGPPAFGSSTTTDNKDKDKDSNNLEDNNSDNNNSNINWTENPTSNKNDDSGKNSSDEDGNYTDYDSGRPSIGGLDSTGPNPTDEYDYYNYNPEMDKNRNNKTTNYDYWDEDEEHSNLNLINDKSEDNDKSTNSIENNTITTDTNDETDDFNNENDSESLSTNTIKEKFKDISCCGNYPLRKPFHTLGGTRGCCGGKTFSKHLMKCCEIDCEEKIRFECPNDATVLFV